MGRPRKDESEKLVAVGLSISPQHEAELKAIAEKEDRERGVITRALYLRGLAAYRRDGLLAEPQGEDKGKVRRRAKLVESTADVGRVGERDSSKRVATKRGVRGSKK